LMKLGGFGCFVRVATAGAFFCVARVRNVGVLY